MGAIVKVVSCDDAQQLDQICPTGRGSTVCIYLMCHEGFFPRKLRDLEAGVFEADEVSADYHNLTNTMASRSQPMEIN